MKYFSNVVQNTNKIDLKNLFCKYIEWWSFFIIFSDFLSTYLTSKMNMKHFFSIGFSIELQPCVLIFVLCPSCLLSTDTHLSSTLSIDFSRLLTLHTGLKSNRRPVVGKTLWEKHLWNRLRAAFHLGSKAKHFRSVSQIENMDEGSEYLKLPVEDRVVHGLWKARLSGYEEARKCFNQWDDDDPSWKKVC